MTDTWHARFVHPQHPWRDFEHPVPFAHEIPPPAAIRRPSSLAGLPAYDIYLLSDSTDWPTSSTYTFAETVLGSLADNDAPENGIDLPSP